MERSRAGSVFMLSLPRSAYRGTVGDQCLCERDNSGGSGWARRCWKRLSQIRPDWRSSALVGCIFGHNEPSLRLFEKLGFERWGFLPRIARVDEVERDLVIVGRHISAEV